MKVFITGASGRLGSRIIPHLISRGHTVAGLVRSTEKAKKIEALGATALIGTTADQGLLRKGANENDAVIHCAMDHKDADLGSQMKGEREALDFFADVLEGSGKVLISANGTVAVQPGSDEHSQSAPIGPRAETEKAVLANAGFIPYVEGLNWSACNADDAALLFVLALETAEPGTIVHAVQEFPQLKAIAQVLGEKTKMDTKAITKEQAKDFGFFGILLQAHQDFSTSWTKKTFGWQPKGQLLLDEMKHADASFFKAV
ncbi:Flavonol reductase/cinnamoyl-CoA reductase [Phaffia rhodozyma]|uniref:Flavonol reductase/cinnamoyl-CoA reductase n=1 Tax=Phaffia rhodozyma TaxID=264483 RepID=A0A0F7SU56_PHARH|nr:Flavonol reductase/cinnamoyl-CoA reductase [Phaffia rhodozyma]